MSRGTSRSWCWTSTRARPSRTGSPYLGKPVNCGAPVHHRLRRPEPAGPLAAARRERHHHRHPRLGQDRVPDRPGSVWPRRTSTAPGGVSSTSRAWVTTPSWSRSVSPTARTPTRPRPPGCWSGSLRGLKKEVIRRRRILTDLKKVGSDLLDNNAAALTDRLARSKKHTMPWMLFIIDEIHEGLADPVYGKDIAALLTNLMKIGRACGIHVEIASQRTDIDSIPTSISSLPIVRVAFHQNGQPGNDMILGTGAYKRGVDATAFRRGAAGTAADDRGSCWFIGSEGGEPVRVRTTFVLPDVKRIVACGPGRADQGRDADRRRGRDRRAGRGRPAALRPGRRAGRVHRRRDRPARRRDLPPGRDPAPRPVEVPGRADGRRPGRSAAAGSPRPSTSASSAPPTPPTTRAWSGPARASGARNSTPRSTPAATPAATL